MTTRIPPADQLLTVFLALAAGYSLASAIFASDRSWRAAAGLLTFILWLLLFVRLFTPAIDGLLGA